MLKVNVEAVIRPAERRIIGMNTNFMTDHEIIRQAGQGYEKAMRQMGIKSLRYPGGDKSDEMLWSLPPWTAPQPTLCVTGPKGRLSPKTDYVEDFTRFKFRPMDFDEFITLCRRLEAEPIVCVCFDSMYLTPEPGQVTAPTREQLLQNAVEWVRYANLVKGYGVKYWELGNESYILGPNGSAYIADYVRDFKVFAAAMKKVDPTIQIGANGHVDKEARGKRDGENGPIWWKVLLEEAAPQIDFLVVHPYPCWKWGSYNYFIQHNENTVSAVDEAVAALNEWASPEDAQRMRILVTETNAADWAASEHYPQLNAIGWPLVNDLGHAIVLFDILGQLLLHPRVDMAEVWNTRWISPAERSLWNTLDENNGLNATGLAISLWGRNLEANMVQVSQTDTLRTYASYDPASRALSVFIINKDRVTQETGLELQGYPSTWSMSQSVLKGQGSEDQSPIIENMPEKAGRGARLDLKLEPVSVTVLRFKPQ